MIFCYDKEDNRRIAALDINGSRIKESIMSSSKTRILKWTITGCAALLITGVLIVLSSLLSETQYHDLQDSEVYRINAEEKAPALISEAPGSAAAPQAAVTADASQEIRGVWIASVENLNYPSKPGLDASTLKAELDAIVTKVAGLGLNAIYFQVRPSSDALYNSGLFPVSAYLSGSQEKLPPSGFDSLAYLVQSAHKAGIQVHAWVNPLRVTAGPSSDPTVDVKALAPNNPASMFPEWTVKYSDLVYYNAGIPAVRELVAAGVAEIVRNYDVDGIIFDDYFYPYPKTGLVFDDAAEFALYGNGMTLEDWRRDNINRMVKGCYDAVKAIDSDCKFGIAPFGIWQNDDGSNDGSDTGGLSSYHSLYCDTLAWVKGGYVDYVAPQIYWDFTTKVARYDNLVHWWNRQLDGTGVDLIISHAAYRAGEFSENEIRNQVEYARSEVTYRGSIFYGYAAICSNEGNLQDQLSALYTSQAGTTPITQDRTTAGNRMLVTSPASGSSLTETATYLIGMSDPAYPLTMNGKSVSRTKNGYFSLYVPLEMGKNQFVFSQNGKTYTCTLTRIKASESTSTVTVPALDSFKVLPDSSSPEIMAAGGTNITLCAAAPVGSTVQATLGSRRVVLKADGKSTGKGAYASCYYTGTLTLPDAAAGQILDAGKILYTATKNDEKASAYGSHVRILGQDATVTVEVLHNETELKIATDSWYYDDYTPAVAGMRAQAVSLMNGYYKLNMGGYIAAKDVREVKSNAPIVPILDAYTLSDRDYTAIYIQLGENIPVNAYVENGKFILSLYNVKSATVRDLRLCSNPMFQSVKYSLPNKANTVRYTFTLRNPDNFYGFSVHYVNGHVVLYLRNPQTVSLSSASPLSGKTILLDAGHGGTDKGALGPNPSYNEADLNLSIVLRAAELLSAKGANVILTRYSNSTVGIYTRLAQLEALLPDLLVSIHQNSMPYSTDVTKVRGLVSLTIADAGTLLSKCVSKAISDSLLCYERTPATQRLAMVRNVQFPSCLVETSFITCVEEYEQMLNGGGIERAAQGLVQGILDYYAAQAAYIK